MKPVAGLRHVVVAGLRFSAVLLLADGLVSVLGGATLGGAASMSRGRLRLGSWLGPNNVSIHVLGIATGCVLGGMCSQPHLDILVGSPKRREAGAGEGGSGEGRAGGGEALTISKGNAEIPTRTSA